MQLKLTKNLEPLREAAIANISVAAEQRRGAYITLGSGKAMVYMEKERQAELVMANPNVDLAQIPLIVEEAEGTDETVFDAAVVILTMAQHWRVVAPAIERSERQAKALVRGASTPAEIEAAVQVAWP
jgi:hypothetical protein